MSLDRLVEEILERGRREAQEILDSTKAERERMLSEVRERGEELINQREEQARDQAQRERQMEIARAELEAKKIVLQAQKEVLDQVLERARERLRGLDSEALLRALVDRHRDDVASGVVHCNKRDALLLRRMVDGEVVDDLDCIGGLVIESSDGTSRTDLRFETILNDLWEDVVKEVAEQLWKGP